MDPEDYSALLNLLLQVIVDDTEPVRVRLHHILCYVYRNLINPTVPEHILRVAASVFVVMVNVAVQFHG